MDKLIKKAIKGDEDAFLQLLMDNYKHLYKIAFYYLGNKEEVLDAMQETSMRAFKNRKKLKKDSSNIKGWLSCILVNYCRDTLKKRGKIIYMEDITLKQDQMKTESGFDTDFIDKVVLNGVMEKLQKVHREVLVMRYFNDMKISDIASTLGKPPSTVKSQIKRAEELCRLFLEEEKEYVV